MKSCAAVGPEGNRIFLPVWSKTVSIAGIFAPCSYCAGISASAESSRFSVRVRHIVRSQPFARDTPVSQKSFSDASIVFGSGAGKMIDMHRIVSSDLASQIGGEFRSSTTGCHLCVVATGSG